MNVIAIGSYSSGTLRPEDLRDALLDMLRGLRLSRADRRLVNEARRAPDDSDDLPEIVNELIDAANNYAPPYCYVGMSEGDGAALGCWPSFDAIDEDVRCGEILVQDDSQRGRNDDVPTGYTGYLAAYSDHGNLTLYRYSRGRSREVWAIV